MLKHFLYITFAAFIFSSCKSGIDARDLYGKWKYIKVDNPNAIPPDSVRKEELARQNPSIEFFPDNRLSIMWGGRELSHGKFTIEGKNIRYQEQLPDGSIRKFPFWVGKLTDKELMFQTSGEEGSRVLAVKE